MMEVLFIVVPLAIVMAGIAATAFIWSVHRGQYDDLDTPRYRALFDDVAEAPARREGNHRVTEKGE